MEGGGGREAVLVLFRDCVNGLREEGGPGGMDPQREPAQEGALSRTWWLFSKPLAAHPAQSHLRTPQKHSRF